MRKTLEFIGYALGISIGLFLFTLIPNFFKYAFSLGALYLGYQFYKRNEGWGMRIAMIVTSIALALLFSVVYTALAYVNGWYINPIYLHGVEGK
ncbi:hypothetical protein [Gorillibacterium sp. CAU 1737]|uniref:hypothetical protein n=1 Tax=Gorillibacterium sp. CAU 1737 TaxID=3140362 RepID=UPI00326064BF